MTVLFMVINWILGVLFGLLFAINLLSRNWLPAVPVLIIALLLLPPVRTLIHQLTGRGLPLWVGSVLILVLFVLFGVLLLTGMAPKHSIYKSSEVQEKLMAIYDDRIEKWPDAHENKYIDSKYGKVHVIISGPEDAPPIVLLHASGVSAWS
jgi:predicted PurR-regulated permease PerM